MSRHQQASTGMSRHEQASTGISRHQQARAGMSSRQRGESHLGYMTMRKTLPRSSACCLPACVRMPPHLTMRRASSSTGSSPEEDLEKRMGLICTLRLMPEKTPPEWPKEP
jgi:hypothetical protein